MTYLRFLLALIVAISHCNVVLFGYIAIGWSAVTAFYIISGLVCAKLIALYKDDLALFLKSRFLRIYPSALFVLAISILILSPYIDFSKLDILLLTAMVIPTNFSNLYFDYFASVFSNNTTKEILLSPYFSIGLELIVYISLFIIFALFKTQAKSVFKILSYLSLLFFTASSVFGTSENHLVNIYFYYCFPFSMFFIFYLGFCLYHKNYKEFFGIYLYIASIFALVHFNGYAFQPFAISIYLGLIVFAPVIFILSRVSIKNNSFIGDMSYLVYLSHYIFINFYILSTQDSTFAKATILDYIFIALGTIAVSLLAYFLIEKRHLYKIAKN